MSVAALSRLLQSRVTSVTVSDIDHYNVYCDIKLIDHSPCTLALLLVPVFTAVEKASPMIVAVNKGVQSNARLHGLLS